MKNFLTHITLPWLLSFSTFFLCSNATAAQTPPKRAIESLTFSNTQTWSPHYLQWAETAADIPEITLPDAPENTSISTRKELALLHSHQKTRTEKNIEEILQEINIQDAFFGQKTLAALIDESHRPNTFSLINVVIQFESPQIMKQKKIHDRVRPSWLDPTLKPVIAVPPHPAYPSGHATQAYLRALLLSELDPKNHRVYQQAAKRIAHNREIAGLHYPSDSKAGALLAKQLFKQLMKNPAFVEHLEKAKTEWR